MREATREGPPCLQVQTIGDISHITIGEEDCLWLSVYTPDLPKSEIQKKRDLKPVMVFGSMGVVLPKVQPENPFILLFT